MQLHVVLISIYQDFETSKKQMSTKCNEGERNFVCAVQSIEKSHLIYSTVFPKQCYLLVLPHPYMNLIKDVVLKFGL